MTDPAVFLEARGLTKRFASVKVLDGVSLVLKPGDVLALMGANGAGKSTLMNILSGSFPADGGTIVLDREERVFASPADAQRAGVAMVHQELHLVPELTIAENIYLGREPLRTFGLIDRREMDAAARSLLDPLGCRCAPTTKVGSLRVAEQQLVEIAKALSFNARLLIFDEPTAALSDREIRDLQRVIRDLQAAGVAIIYTSHRMEEVFAVATHVVVLRDGRLMSSRPVDKVSRDQLIEDMVGSQLAQTSQPHREVRDDSRLFEASGLTRRDTTGRAVLADLRFVVRRGEILGIGGLMGSGRTELLEILAGTAQQWSGTMMLDGEAYRPQSPAEAIADGVAYVTEDRKQSGLVLEQSIGHNIALASLQALSVGGLLQPPKEKALNARSIRRLSIKCAGSGQAVGRLSGGNQQKVVLAKWLATNPRLLLLDEPTRGIDVAAKASFYTLLDALLSEGIGVLLVSSEWEELMALSDRILVLQEGRSAAMLSRDDFSQQRLLEHATPGGPIAPAFAFAELTA